MSYLTWNNWTGLNKNSLSHYRKGHTYTTQTLKCFLMISCKISFALEGLTVGSGLGIT